MNDTHNSGLETRQGASFGATSLSGRGFSPAENNAARSAPVEGVWGNPLRVSPGSSLDGAWIEIFRAGDYGERGNWTADDLDRVAAAYDPRKQSAPVVLGHPADDAPAYGWVKRLRRAGQSLWAQLEKVDPVLESLLRAGRFAQRSVALYRQFPLTGGPYLRHVGFLGAAPPAVKGLAAVRFADAEFQTIDAQFQSIASISSPGDQRSSEVFMSEPKSKLESFVDHLRSFFLPDPPTATPAGEGSADPSPVPPSDAFAERLAALEQRLEAVTSAKTSAEQKLAEVESDKSRAQVANFVETLRSQGRFPPMFEGWGVREFMERLARLEPGEAGEKNVCATDPSESLSGTDIPVCPPTLLVWFQEFLSKLPAVIEFRELGPSSSHRPPVTSHRSPVVRFTEPQRGMSVDPASVELAERAETLAAEESISYADALTRLREERRAPSTA